LFEERGNAMMLSPKLDLDKPGVKRLEQVGPFAVIANRKLFEHGKSTRFAVVNTHKEFVDSVHENYRAALSRARNPM
jgi:hypothetical protein